VAGFGVNIKHISSNQQDLHQFATSVDINSEFNFSDISYDATNISGMNISGVQVPENGLLSLFFYKVPIENGLINTHLEITAKEESFFDGDGIAFSVSDFIDINLINIDTDLDGNSDLVDVDDDNDGVEDALDVFPFNASEAFDNDNDGIGNNADTDDDNDGVLDLLDPFPFDPLEWEDLNLNGIGDNSEKNSDINDNNQTWDFDGSGEVDALTDGLLLLRYTFGLRGSSLVIDAKSPSSLLTDTEIENFIATASVSYADIDGEGTTDALTDGLLFLRYLFGLRGSGLVADVIKSGATRNNSSLVEEYIEGYMP
jgi:hypothetical protein